MLTSVSSICASKVCYLNLEVSFYILGSREALQAAETSKGEQKVRLIRYLHR